MDITPLNDIQKGKEGKPSMDRRAWLTVLGGFCINIVLGNQYLWGNIASYVVSYFHYKGDPNAINSVIINVIPISFGFQFFITPIAPWL